MAHLMDSFRSAAKTTKPESWIFIVGDQQASAYRRLHYLDLYSAARKLGLKWQFLSKAREMTELGKRCQVGT